MKVVKVYGALKERLGGQGTFELDVFNAAEAIKALCANFSGLDKWLVDSGQDGIVYKVLLGETEVGEDNLENLFVPWSAKETFHITPVLAGSKGGFGRFLGGALMLGAVLATGGWAAGAINLSGGLFSATVFGASLGKMVGYMGIALMLGGVSEMLTPVPKAPPEANKLKSFSFSGIQQTAQQGGAIPIVYGKCFVGSAVLSAGLDTFDA
tara:strand:+ start:1540 stop:2169 length:630 start_codon:yes stop_codon:yes gene_type:complete